MGIFLFLDRTLDWEMLSLTLAARVRLNIIQESRDPNAVQQSGPGGEVRLFHKMNPTKSLYIK